MKSSVIAGVLALPILAALPSLASAASSTIQMSKPNTAQFYTSAGKYEQINVSACPGLFCPSISNLTVNNKDYTRQFLVFDWTGLQSNEYITSVTLDFTFSYAISSGLFGNKTAELTFWDATLPGNINNGGKSFFNDLGSGDSYGKVTIADNSFLGLGQSATMSITLNYNAIKDLASQGKFVIGIDANTKGAISGAIKSAELTVNTQVAAVPLPGAALLFGPAIVGLGAIRRRYLKSVS